MVADGVVADGEPEEPVEEHAPVCAGSPGTCSGDSIEALVDIEDGPEGSDYAVLILSWADDPGIVATHKPIVKNTVAATGWLWA